MTYWYTHIDAFLSSYQRRFYLHEMIINRPTSGQGTENKGLQDS